MNRLNRLSADRPPTARQARVLHFIAQSIRERGFPPTHREVCGAMGLLSTNGAADHINALVRRGLLTQAPMLSRGLVLTDRGRAFIEASSDAAERTTEGT
jgi:repressor LexA